MRSVAELLGSAEGRALLEARGIALDATAFVEALRPPAEPRLVEVLGLPAGSRPVYVAHQAHIDLGRSAASKFRSAAALPGDDVEPVALWLDMDRTGSDKASTTIVWALPDGPASARLVPQKLRDREPRFVPVERERLEEVVAQLGAWIEGTIDDREGRERARARLEGLTAALLDGPTTLAEANVAVSTHVLAEGSGARMASAMVSTLCAGGLLSDALREVVLAIDDVVLVFNTAIDELVALDVDPLVHPLGEDYLPLSYACDDCSARRRLTLERRGTDRSAVMTCSCGGSRRFDLGDRSAPLAELEATRRWSTDVTLPVYLNDLASGVVAGRSSAIYGLVLNEVLEKVLGRAPIPMLLPGDLLDAMREAEHGTGLVYAYLVGH